MTVLAAVVVVAVMVQLAVVLMSLVVVVVAVVLLPLQAMQKPNQASSVGPRKLTQAMQAQIYNTMLQSFLVILYFTLAPPSAPVTGASNCILWTLLASAVRRPCQHWC